MGMVFRKFCRCKSIPFKNLFGFMGGIFTILKAQSCGSQTLMIPPPPTFDTAFTVWNLSILKIIKAHKKQFSCIKVVQALKEHNFGLKGLEMSMLT